MENSELIKNFERIRDYMRQFYVYGYHSRSEMGMKSPRSYDNERRRIESWLGEHMSFRREETGKQVFISMDSRSLEHWKNALDFYSESAPMGVVGSFLLDRLPRQEIRRIVSASAFFGKHHIHTASCERQLVSPE